MYDRRHSNRFSITGARVHFTNRSNEVVQVALADLTNSSVRFKIDEELIIGDELMIGIDVPEIRLVVVRGTVVWSANPLIEEPAYAVVQFLPFGTDSRYNSMHVREQIRNIIENYGSRIDPDAAAGE